MHYSLDKENDGRIWVDRGADDRADHFRPCPPCYEEMREQDHLNSPWREFSPCGKCEINFALEIARRDMDPESRPLVLDRLHQPYGADNPGGYDAMDANLFRRLP
ncbi:MAG: hypothetical protein KC931_21735 [Candidatus Omnitrophica bacterium]|nr:hypothetical protein [Candidatus Omnitrophota bacterium]